MGITWPFESPSSQDTGGLLSVKTDIEELEEIAALARELNTGCIIDTGRNVLIPPEVVSSLTPTTSTMSENEPSIHTSSFGFVPSLGSTPSILNATLLDRMDAHTDLVSTWHHIPLTEANMEQLSSSQIVSDGHSSSAVMQAGSESALSPYIRVNTRLNSRDIQAIILLSQLKKFDIHAFHSILMLQFDHTLEGGICDKQFCFNIFSQN